MAQQAETHPYPIRRANILFDQNAIWTEDDIRQYGKLAKSMLSMGCWNIPNFEEEERILSSTDNMAFMLLNLGDLEREPRRPGRQTIPPYLIQNGACTVLPVFKSNNPGHVNILCEASGIHS